LERDVIIKEGRKTESTKEIKRSVERKYEH
jgi:hypothetical protein